MRAVGLLLLGFFILGIDQVQAALVCAKKVCVDVEEVTTSEDMRRGLQGRKELIFSHGMLFIFKQEGLQRFWMKDMNFPIDMIWINDQKRIVAIESSSPVCISDPCEVYSPPFKARYVLEVPAGFTLEHQWGVGDVLKFKKVKQK